MQFKEIKPGMNIHCNSFEEKMMLLEELGRLGYLWCGSRNYPTEATSDSGSIIHIIDDRGQKRLLCSNSFNEVTHEFSDLIPEVTAAEAVEWLATHYFDGELTKVFGQDDFGNNIGIADITTKYSPDEIIKKISEWKMKVDCVEPELEVIDVCRILEIRPNGSKQYVHTEVLEIADEDGAQKKIKIREQCKKILIDYYRKHPSPRYVAIHDEVYRLKT